MKKYHIITFGCQMNKADSERVAAVFEHLNCSAADKVEDADYIILNACSVRQTAIDRIWGLVNDLQKRKTKQQSIILTGCLLKKDKQKLEDRFDLIFNIKELFVLERFLHAKQEYTTLDYFETLPRPAKKYQVYVPIMTGCNNYCSYCAVPYVRGREESRPVRAVLNEIKTLVALGAKEVQLLGQNVNSYDPPDKEQFSQTNPFRHSFAGLLFEVNQIPDLARVHFISSHPKDMEIEVIRALTLAKQVNYLHLALQSGDDEILRMMNRQYTSEHFAEIIKQVRCWKPEIAIGTDIIVGFPGEREEQFKRTLDFYREMDFDIAYTAMYSVRSGTAAANLPDDVPWPEKKRRWQCLQTVMEQIIMAKNQKYVGRMVEVLVDTVRENYCEGNSREMKRVRIDRQNIGKQLVAEGALVQVKIKAAKEWLLLA